MSIFDSIKEFFENPESDVKIENRNFKLTKDKNGFNFNINKDGCDKIKTDTKNNINKYKNKKRGNN